MRKLGDHAPAGLLTGRSCWRKVEYDSETQALWALDHLLQRKGESGGDMVAYKCWHCPGWHFGHDTLMRRLMADVDLRAALANGGLVTVLLGKDYDLPPDFAFHAQVHGVAANNVNLNNMERDIPSNSRIVVLTDRIAQPVYEGIKRECTRRRLPYLLRKTPAAVEAVLRDIVPKKAVLPPPPTAMAAALAEGQDGGDASPSPAAGNGESRAISADERATKTDVEPRTTLRGSPSTVAPKGAIAALAKEADLDKSVAEEARRLFKLAQQRGIQTTIGSVSQGITNRKRTERRSATPQSIVPENLKVLRVLEDSIAGLQLVRDYVDRVETENGELKSKIALLKEAFGKLND